MTPERIAELRGYVGQFTMRADDAGKLASRLAATLDALEQSYAMAAFDLEAYRLLLDQKRSAEEALDLVVAERDRHREFAERLITPCEWGPGAFVSDNDEDIEDAAVRLGLLEERPHPQPCADEHCECDGSPTLLHFTWRA